MAKPASVKAAASWSKLVSSGQFTDVIAQAEAAGISHVLTTRAAAELGALAHAAHYTGNSGLAVKAWNALRKRFTGSGAATGAAFFLGRLHDQRGQLSTALTWFETYLAEAPGGVYSTEAHGRRLNLVRQLRGVVAARTVASEYLRRYPKGPYKKTAQDIVASQ
jgi:hypothetical protein